MTIKFPTNRKLFKISYDAISRSSSSSSYSVSFVGIKHQYSGFSSRNHCRAIGQRAECR